MLHRSRSFSETLTVTLFSGLKVKWNLWLHRSLFALRAQVGPSSHCCYYYFALCSQDRDSTGIFRGFRFAVTLPHCLHSSALSPKVSLWCPLTCFTPCFTSLLGFHRSAFIACNSWNRLNSALSAIVVQVWRCLLFCEPCILCCFARYASRCWNDCYS